MLGCLFGTTAVSLAEPFLGSNKAVHTPPETASSYNLLKQKKAQDILKQKMLQQKATNKRSHDALRENTERTNKKKESKTSRHREI